MNTIVMKKYAILLFVFIGCFCSMSCFSQLRDSIAAVYRSQTIYEYGNHYMKDGRKLSYEQLASEFTTPSIQEMYRKSKRRLGVSRIFNVASLGVIIASIFTKTNVGGSVAFAASTGVLGITSIYFKTQSDKYVQRALWERNQMILLSSLPR